MKKNILNRDSGFALIATIIILSLMMMVSLAMVSLQSVSTKSSSNIVYMDIARANARLALAEAIGKLQEALGPDQRVTANAKIIAANTGQPHMLGVWDSFKADNSLSSGITYDKNAAFRGWLSSGQTIDPTASATDPVMLFHEGSMGTDTANYVYGTLVNKEDDSGNLIGKYAWNIMDESQKANIRVHPDIPTTDNEKIASLTTAGRAGVGSLATNGYASLATEDQSTSRKLVSVFTAELAGGSYDPAANAGLHSVTIDSKSLLVDVVNGGYQQDLSTMFAESTLPALKAGTYIYSESSSPIALAPTRLGGGVNESYAHPIPSPDPSWSILHTYHNLYKSVNTSGSTYSIEASVEPWYTRGLNYAFINDPEKIINPPFFEETQLQPVVSNAQFIFSMAPQSHGSSTPYVGFLGFWVDFAITLWNPYNVELEIDELELDFYRFPLQLEFFRNDSNSTPLSHRYPNRDEPHTVGGDNDWISASDGEPIHIAYMFNPGNNPSGVLHVQDKLPYRVILNESTTLKPGEFRVFGYPTRTIYHHQNWNFTRGHEITSGWSPYNTSNNQGGVYERYISTSSTYQARCPFRAGTNAFSQQIRIKEGDRYKVRVTPAKVNRTTSYKETDDQEIVSYMKLYAGRGGSITGVSDLEQFEEDYLASRSPIGAIEIDMSDAEMVAALPTIEPDDLPILEVLPENTWPQGNAAYKQPFLIASLRLKTEQDSNESLPHWLHNGATSKYFTDGLNSDQSVNKKAHKYEMTWEPMTDWSSIPAVEIDSLNRGYGATGVTSAEGVNFAPIIEVPLAPPTSLAQFSHAELNPGGQAPYTSQVVGNSVVSPLMSPDVKLEATSFGTMLDHSYMANNTLFDTYFLSTAVAELASEPLFSTDRDLNAVVNDFLSNDTLLRNPHFVKSEKAPSSAVNIETAVTLANRDTTENYTNIAQFLYNEGAFNVNSTSIEAWALFLASGNQESLPILDVLTASTTLEATSSSGAAFSRFSPLTGDEMGTVVSNDAERWASHRRLTSVQILELATNVVTEVKARGPFQSVSEFVNRRLSNGADGKMGTLQAAIDASSINDSYGEPAAKDVSEITLTATSFTSDTSYGSPSHVMQSDILNRIAPSLTVRGDTFRVRAYGAAYDNGTIQAETWCEAIVQRGHDFMDDSDESIIEYINLNTMNQRYGRKFKVISFRWLSEEEV